jgi:hypothetical protein
MIRRAAAAAILISIAVALSFHNRGGSRSGPAALHASTRPTVPAGNGGVSGVVKFAGEPPTPLVVTGECCPGSPPVVEETTVVGPTGGLANVVVYIKDGPNVVNAGELATANLDQHDCHYIPHVLAVHTDQPVNITSHDPTVHNVDVQAAVNPPANFSETFVGASNTISFALPEFVHVKCDVHPWMSATVAVFNHPFFAVTGKDGAFAIPRLPAGSYTLVAWHEEYGSLEQPIIVSDQKPAMVNFTYKAP